MWRKLILAWRDPNAENCLIINMTFFGFNAELSRGVSALSPHVDEQEVAREAWGLDILENVNIENAARAKTALDYWEYFVYSLINFINPTIET